MTATLIPFPVFRAFDSDGAPLSGGLLYTYQAGTSTPLATYTDQSGNTANTNPVVLDSTGSANVWLGASSYKMVLKDADSVIQWTVDNVQSQQALIDGVYTNLVNTSDINKGDALIGVKQPFTGATSTTQHEFNSRNVSVFDFFTQDLRNDVVNRNFTLDCSSSIQAALDYVGGFQGTLYFPAGTYRLDQQVNVPIRTSMIGSGTSSMDDSTPVGGTLFKAGSTMDSMFNLESDISNPSFDGHFPSFQYLRGFTLWGASKADWCMKIANRHMTHFTDLYFFEGVMGGCREYETYFAYRENCCYTGTGTGLYLVGSNHSSKWVRCELASNNQCMVIENNALGDGNEAIIFDTCSFQYSVGGIDLTVTNVTFISCVIGEGVTSTKITVRQGKVNLIGCMLKYDKSGDADPTLINPLGGVTSIVNCNIGSQGGGHGLKSLIGGGTGVAGKVGFTNCRINSNPAGGAQYVYADVIDYGPKGQVFADRLGKNWTATGNGVTFTSVVSGNSQTFTATSSGASFEARSTLVNNSQWRDGEKGYLVLVYEASQDVLIRLQGSAFGGSPLKGFGGDATAWPGTSNGLKCTTLAFDTTLDSAAYTQIAVAMLSPVIGSYITIHECYFADSSQLVDRGYPDFANLYKC